MHAEPTCKVNRLLLGNYRGQDTIVEVTIWASDVIWTLSCSSHMAEIRGRLRTSPVLFSSSCRHAHSGIGERVTNDECYQVPHDTPTCAWVCAWDFLPAAARSHGDSYPGRNICQQHAPFDSGLSHDKQTEVISTTLLCRPPSCHLSDTVPEAR